MLKNKTLLFFFAKLIVVFSFLTLPLSLFDSTYGKFYRAVAAWYFDSFRETGVAKFRETKDKSITRIDVGNRAYKHSNGAIDTATSEFNTRYRGYVPTIFLLSLIVASPVKWRRRLFAMFSGLLIITLFVMLKQYIHLIYICAHSQWLKLYEFSEKEVRKIDFMYFNLANYNGPSLILAIAVWILVTFRKSDLEILKQ